MSLQSLFERLKRRWTNTGQVAAHSVRRDWQAALATHPNPLLRRGEKHFSQFDEDGILLEILRRLHLTQGRFLEIGVGDGTENNTLILIAHGWSGQWLGAETLAWEPSGRRLQFTRTFVTAENVVSLLQSRDVDVFSLDIDGNDWWVAQTLLAHISPRVIVVEYNAKVPPPVAFVMPYDANHRWDGSDYYGASLAGWAALFERFGYIPVCCSFQGTNAFFVRAADRHLFADVPATLAELYRPAVHIVPYDTGHRTSPRTLAALERQ